MTFPTTVPTTVPTISVAALRGLLASDQPPTLVDVRSRMEFATRHVPAAKSLPLDELTPASLRSAGFAGNGPLYAICQSGTRSAKACAILAAAGIMDAVSVEGGTSAWVQAGLPVSSTPRHSASSGSSISIERQVRIVAGGVSALWLGIGLDHPPCLSGDIGFRGGGFGVRGRHRLLRYGTFACQIALESSDDLRVSPLKIFALAANCS